MTNKPPFAGEKVRLGDLGKTICGGTPSSKHPEFFAGSIPWIGTTALNGGKLDKADAVKLITREAVEKSATKIIPPNSIMVGIRVGVGKVAINSVPMCTSQDIVSVVSIDEAEWCKEYISMVLQYKAPVLAAQAQGATITGISSKTLKSITIPVAPLETQRRIVEELRAIEAQKVAANSILKSFSALVKSRFVEMFGDPTNGVAWPSKRLDEICTIVTGNTPPRKDPSNYGDYIEWCKTDNITDAKYLTTASEMLSEEGALRGRVVPAGSILMACIAGSVKSIGKVAVADRSVAFNQQINALIPSEMIDVEYLLWALRLSKDYLCSGVNMQLKGILNKTSLSAKSFCVPPLALQQQFAAFVAEVDKSRFVVQKQIEKLQALYDSLAQEYFG